MLRSLFTALPKRFPQSPLGHPPRLSFHRQTKVNEPKGDLSRKAWRLGALGSWSFLGCEKCRRRSLALSHEVENWQKKKKTLLIPWILQKRLLRRSCLQSPETRPFLLTRLPTRFEISCSGDSAGTKTKEKHPTSRTRAVARGISLSSFYLGRLV